MSDNSLKGETMKFPITVDDIAVKGISSGNPYIEDYSDGHYNPSNQNAHRISKQILYNFLDGTKRNSHFKKKTGKEPSSFDFFDSWEEFVNQAERCGGIGELERLVNDVFEDSFAPWLGFSKNLVRIYMADRFQDFMSERAKALWFKVVSNDIMRRRLSDHGFTITREYIEKFPEATRI
ncbi:hypothetical protein EOM71_00550 [Candidatus Falkowbacteria bacterium]|nr:hypothetical protein [Candidatus Falkowbacteria bacterium]